MTWHAVVEGFVAVFLTGHSLPHDGPIGRAAPETFDGSRLGQRCTLLNEIEHELQALGI